MTQRFVRGGSGKFTFDVANNLLDTAERLEGNMPSDDSKSARLNDRPIVARLTERLTHASAGFELTPPQTYLGAENIEFFRWTAVEVQKGTTGSPDMLRFIATMGDSIPGSGLNSQIFGATPSGIAVKINGLARVGDLVLLQAFPTYGSISNERFFAFYGATDPVLSGTFGMLKILDHQQQGGSDRWTYSVRGMFYRVQAGGNGFILENIEGSEGVALNLYEANRYGQPLFQPDGRIEIVGPIPTGSLVLGSRQGRDLGGQIMYVFSAVNGYRAICVQAAMDQQQGDARLLRDGI